MGGRVIGASEWLGAKRGGMKGDGWQSEGWPSDGPE
jgi:hypothetical protein